MARAHSPPATSRGARGITFLDCVKSRRHVIPVASAKARGAPQHMRLCSRDPAAAVVQHHRMDCSGWEMCVWGGGVRHKFYWHLSDHTVSTRRRANRVPPTPVAPNLARDISAGADDYFFTGPVLLVSPHFKKRKTEMKLTRNREMR